MVFSGQDGGNVVMHEFPRDESKTRKDRDFDFTLRFSGSYEESLSIEFAMKTFKESRAHA